MTEQKKISFLKNAVSYSGINIISQFILLIRGLVVRRILPPEIMGFWNFVAVVQGFIATIDFGCIAGANRELPIMRGKHDYEEETKIRSTALWFTFFQNIVIGIFALVYVWWNRTEYVPLEIVAAIFAVFMFILTSFFQAYMTFFQGAQAFVLLSKLLLVIVIIESVGFLIGAYVWDLGGLMTMAMLSSCLKVGLFVYFGQLTNLTVRLKIYKHILKRLLSFGFFLRLIDYPNALFAMASLLWVTKFMSIADLAFFTMARSFFLQVSDVSTRVGSVYAMRFLEQAGRGVQRSIMARQLRQYLLFQLLVAVPLLSWAASVALPFMVRNFIPKYAAANQAIIILLICSFFYVLNSGLTNPWILEKKLASRGIANVVGLTIMIIALSVPWFILEIRTINIVAYSTLAGYFLYFVYMVIAVGKDLWNLYECAEIILSVALAAGWAFVIFYSGYVSIEENKLFIEDLKATLFMGGWTLLAILPIALYGLKRSQIYKGWL
jgi:O-antigen/teichoic acid export membrane protein